MRIKLQKIICTTDFSELSNQTLAFGEALAKEFGARLLVCHINEKSFAALSTYGEVYIDTQDLEKQELGAAREKITALMAAADVEWEPLVAAGHPATEISRLAVAEKADLVIAATHGRSGIKRLLLGSVSERLLRTLPCPFLVVRDTPPTVAAMPAETALRFQRILVGCDFSEDSRLAYDYGLSLAQEFQSQLYIAHVLEPPVYRDLSLQARDSREELETILQARLNEKLTAMVPPDAYAWCSPEAVLLKGRPDEQLIGYAQERNVDLIVLGAKGRGLVETLLVGSTTDRVMRQTPCPVLSVPLATQDPTDANGP